jgi:hypothetical protein
VASDRTDSLLFWLDAEVGQTGFAGEIQFFDNMRKDEIPAYFQDYIFECDCLLAHALKPSVAASQQHF